MTTSPPLPPKYEGGRCEDCDELLMSAGASLCLPCREDRADDWPHLKEALAAAQARAIEAEIGAYENALALVTKGCDGDLDYAAFQLRGRLAALRGEKEKL
jgi:hypothetical protein